MRHHYVGITWKMEFEIKLEKNVKCSEKSTGNDKMNFDHRKDNSFDKNEFSLVNFLFQASNRKREIH